MGAFGVFGFEGEFSSAGSLVAEDGDIAVELVARFVLSGQARTKSMKPRSTSVWISLTWMRSPTSRPWNPRSSLPSAGGRRSRTHVPLSEAPVTMPSNCSPILPERSSAAADFRTRRSTFVAASSCSVQCFASSVSSGMV